MQIKVLDDDNCENWDAYVHGHPKGSFFHLSGWRNVIVGAARMPAIFLYAEDSSGIRGVLPLGHSKSLLFGNSLVSTPFCVYGGTLADDVTIAARLEDRAIEIGHEKGVDYVEFRNRVDSGSGRPKKDLYVTFIKNLHTQSQENFDAIPRKQRAMVRKGISAGLTSILDSSIDRHYTLYSESVRNLGTPVFTKKLFQMIFDVFGESCEILTVEKNGIGVSSVMSFIYKDQVLPYYGGGGATARGVYANDFMYWEVMRRACERGITVFDFGRSKRGTGSYHFKKHWGFEEQNLCYEYEMIRAKKIPDVNPLNPKYKLLISVWKRLPLPLSQLVGPMISRNLG